MLSQYNNNKKFQFSVFNMKTKNFQYHAIHTIDGAIVQEILGNSQEVSALNSLMELSNTHYRMFKHVIYIDYTQISKIMFKVCSISEFTHELDPAQLLDFHEKYRIWHRALAEQATFHCRCCGYVYPCVKFEKIAGLTLFEKMMTALSQEDLSSVFSPDFLIAYPHFNAATEQQSFHEFPFDQQKNVQYCIEHKTLCPSGAVDVETEYGTYGSEISSPELKNSGQIVVYRKP